ncbi:hypothetical protein HOY82DRAFT_633605 [Tuber indicum]|nr:hypothetical protein HOY82DRAFT_633605 [Tuber indicum]
MGYHSGHRLSFFSRIQMHSHQGQICIPACGKGYGGVRSVLPRAAEIVRVPGMEYVRGMILAQ